MVVEAGWKSLHRVKVPLISAEGCERRASHDAGLINALKLLPPNQIIFFSDEKNFVINPVNNPQNDRWIRFGGGGGGKVGKGGGKGDDAGKFIGRSMHPATAMFLGAVASTRETSMPIWFKSGFCLGAEEYVKVLKKTLIPWMRLVAKSYAIAGVPAAFTLQQDSAPAGIW